MAHPAIVVRSGDANPSPHTRLHIQPCPIHSIAGAMVAGPVWHCEAVGGKARIVNCKRLSCTGEYSGSATDSQLATTAYATGYN